MSEKRDYYDVLGISRNASQDEIKRVYKELAKKYHPDLNKEAGAEEKFKEILEAYSVLNDPSKRQAFDNFGFAGEGTQWQGFDFSEFFKNRGTHFDFSDLFDDFGFTGFNEMFGFEKARKAPTRGFDLRYDLELSFEEAVNGAEKTIEIEKTESCSACKGKGFEKESDWVKCEACNGKGMTERTQRTGFGIFSTRSTCRKCSGEGTIIKNPCSECQGKGFVRVRKKVKVKIPAGIDHGNHLRLKGEGSAGSDGARAGDLFIVIFVKPHEIFKRDGSDLYCEIPISFSEAALGAIIEAPTIEGTAKLKMPEGTQTDTVFKLKGQGVKNLHESGKGDEFVKVMVETPEKLSSEQRELFEELARIEKKKGKSILEKFKDRMKRKKKN